MSNEDGLPILETLRHLGVTVKLSGVDRLRLEPARAIPTELVAEIREAKAAIIEALRTKTAKCSTECYEASPGVWIHRPWKGCTTILPEASEPLRKVQSTCWHCGGTQKCNCIACGQPSGPGECVSCRARTTRSRVRRRGRIVPR